MQHMITYKVHFIRHGMTQGNLEGKYIGSTDLPVCPEGYRQLDDLKAHYEYPKVEAVYSSPMLRCRQTADFLYPNAMLTVVEDLREWNFGDFEGKTMEELKDDPDYLDWIASSMKSTPPGGESSKEFAARLQLAIGAIFRDMMDQGIPNAAIVTHGGVIMTLMSEYALPRGQNNNHWMAPNGQGFTVLMTPQMWMRDGGFEVYNYVPVEPELADFSGIMGFDSGEDWDE